MLNHIKTYYTILEGFVIIINIKENVFLMTIETFFNI